MPEGVNRFAVCFNQIWPDVDINLRVGGELAPRCESLVDETQDSSTDPPYYINRIEELLRRADLSLSVLTFRPAEAGLRRSTPSCVDWRAAMDESLRKATQFVALVSPTCDQSQTCTAETEGALARGTSVSILLFKVLGRQIPHPRLTGTHNQSLRSEDPGANAEEIVRNIVERLDTALQRK